MRVKAVFKTYVNGSVHYIILNWNLFKFIIKDNLFLIYFDSNYMYNNICIIMKYDY